ncbi:MAG: aldehyde dehydrogenase family protein [Actinomycetota bacterium]
MAQAKPTRPRAATRKRTTKTTRSRVRAPQKLKSLNPRTGEIRSEVQANAPGEISDVVDRARKVAPEWAAIAPEGRGRFMREVRHRIYDRMDDIVETVAAECGKPRNEALAHDVIPPMIILMSLEALAPRALRPEKIGLFTPPVLPKLLSGTSARTEWRPFGVVGCITPWNYPITNSFVAFAPALFAGNAVVIKPSEVTPACGELIRDLLEPLPSGVATVIQGGEAVGAALVDAPVDKVSFIGSPATGRKICESAAKHLTPVVMELGGKDAAIVCSDADLDFTSSGILWGSFYNAGQTCCSIERAYVVDSVADEFKEKLLGKLATLRQGDDVGSLTFSPQLDIVKEHVSDATGKGARVLAGGQDAGIKNRKGSLWYAPTVLESVSSEMTVLRQETFGPVLTIVTVHDEDEAVKRANEDGVNLTASVWSSSRALSDSISTRLRAGTVTVNLHGETAASAWSPWGGVGESGFGRLNGLQGIREFVYAVNVTRNTNTRIPRLWWYPYDDATERAFRSIAGLFGAPSRSKRFEGFTSLVGNAAAALKKKI